MESVFYSSGDETPETPDEINDSVFENTGCIKQYRKPDDNRTKESDLSDEETNISHTDNENISLDKNYGFSFKNPKNILQTLQQKGNVVRDGMMNARPDVSDDDNDVEDNINNTADEPNAEVGISIVHHNHAYEASDSTVSVTPQHIELPVNPSTHEDGIMSSRAELPEEIAETEPERTNVVNPPEQLIPKTETGKGKEVVNTDVQEVKVIRINNKALPKDAETYQLETFEKNAMIIFNQENIDGYEPRKGSEKDVDALSNTFSKFGFEIEPHKDLQRIDVFKELERFSEQDFTDYGCVAVVILTHGSDMGSLRAKDRRFYENDVINFFRASVNQTLVTKPILIIIQACRGTKISKAMPVAKEGKIRKDTDNLELQPYTLPVESDMLVLHSTYPGKVSFRNDLCGSWFIQTLCKKIDELATTQDLDSIMSVTKRVVASDMEHTSWNRNIKEHETNKQMPVITSTLIRKLYLRKYESGVPKTSPMNYITTVLESQVDGYDRVMDNVETVNRNIANPIGALKTPDCYFCSSPKWPSYFNYLRGILQHYVEDPQNSEDSTAKCYLTLAHTLKDTADFEDAKEKLAKIITEYLEKNAQHLDYYKLFYLNNSAGS